MKNKFITAILLLVTVYSLTAQSRKGDFRLQDGSSSHSLYISLTPQINFEDSAAYAEAIITEMPEFEKLVQEYNITLQPGIVMPEAKIAQLKKDALAISGNDKSVSKLKNILLLSIDNPTNERLAMLAEKLEALKDVEYCSLVSNQPVKLPADIAPATPLFESRQAYMDNRGVNMDYAWGMGLTGQGINIKDVEFGFNKNHEELADVNALIGGTMEVSPDADVDFTEHGTAVIGVMYAHKGNYGISGMAYGANEMLLFPEYSTEAGYNRVYTITQAINASLPGEIMLYELQATGALGEYGPAEYENIVWDLTKAATDAGVVIIAAAGNGGEDLDAPAYQSYRRRGDSGAIIVGAGTPNQGRDRLDFSTYGARVDVQGWGYNVFTTGYGDVLELGGDFNQRYTNFSGTSSATPIVASCVVVLQSYYKSLTGNYMTGVEIRELLQETGNPQGFGNEGNIGPLPDMKAAVDKLTENHLNTASNEKLAVILYPNPVHDKLTIKGQQLSGSTSAQLYNTLGQMIYNGVVEDNGEINVSSLSAGIYTLKLSNGGREVTKKIIKK